MDDRLGGGAGACFVKIYTRTGDDGTTGLLGPGRVPKDGPRIEAYGTVDELNAALGVVRAARLDPAMDSLVAQIQDDLFVVGAALADPDPAGRFHNALRAERIAALEQSIDDLEAELEPLACFILPGGSEAAAHLHLARTICRRAERRITSLMHETEESVAAEILVYVNRLSDLLFVLARAANAREGVADTPWHGL